MSKTLLQNIEAVKRNSFGSQCLHDQMDRVYSEKIKQYSGSIRLEDECMNTHSSDDTKQNKHKAYFIKDNETKQKLKSI